MTTLHQLLDVVDEVFAARDPQLVVWPPPREFGVSPADWEYSNVADPGKWRIIGARADAWVEALVSGGFATVEPVRREDLRWSVAVPTVISSAVRVMPSAAGALPLVVARSRMGHVSDAGVTLGVGDPVVWAGAFPDCGCDACDGGAEGDLAYLDSYLGSVVVGTFRRVARGAREIVVISDGMSATGSYRAGDLERILANPKGWDDLSGSNWLA